MTRFLWTGESEYCLCGHHVEEHETRQSLPTFNELNWKLPTNLIRYVVIMTIEVVDVEKFTPYRKEKNEKITNTSPFA